MTVRASCSHAVLIVDTREGKRPKPVSLPQRRRSWTRAWARCRASSQASGVPHRDRIRELAEQTANAAALGAAAVALDVETARAAVLAVREMIDRHGASESSPVEDTAPGT